MMTGAYYLGENRLRAAKLENGSVSTDLLLSFRRLADRRRRATSGSVAKACQRPATLAESLHWRPLAARA